MAWRNLPTLKEQIVVKDAPNKLGWEHLQELCLCPGAFLSDLKHQCSLNTCWFDPTSLAGRLQWQIRLTVADTCGLLL